MTVINIYLDTVYTVTSDAPIIQTSNFKFKPSLNFFTSLFMNVDVINCVLNVL